MSSARTRTPVDQPVRDRLTSDFATNFLVEAGAGSGKTQSLATRMAAGVAAGVYTVEGMAVVTFTRKAAAELRGRFQLALEDRLRATPPETERCRLEAALAGMERLVAGTIHSFCARLLRERPVDARIAPGFEELSDIGNLHRQRRAWRDFVAGAVAGGRKPMLDLLEAGIKPKDLDEAFASVCEHQDVEFDMGSGEPPEAAAVWLAIDALWKQLTALRPAEFSENTTCAVQLKWDDFEGWLGTARRGRLASLAAFLGAWGRPKVTQKYWDKEVGRPAGIGRQVKELVDDFQADVVEPFQARWMAYVHRLAMQVLIEGRSCYAAERRRQNVVNYVDLLSVTADTLRRCGDARHALQQKYRFLFIDEFQDTDPIQAEIFLMLAADEPAALGREACVERRAGDTPIDPFTVPLRPGALFVVGDPKQSIFRFRRADIDIYNCVADRIRATGGAVVALTANFRSLPGVCDVANTVFPSLFARHPVPYSPEFAELDPVRTVARRGIQPCIAALTVAVEGDGVKHEVKEAARIAAYIEAEVKAGRRRYGDFLVLARQTTRLGIFVEAFDARQIPVDVSGAGLFCQSQEVQVLASLLAALADPLDSVALVGVLRGPLFGHSDPELFAFHQGGGAFELSRPLPEGDGTADSRAREAVCGPVLGTMRRLRAMWEQTRTLPAGAAVERILDDTGWLALASTTPGGARAGHLLQAVDRVRQVVEEGGGLAEAAIALNEEEKSSESEAMPLEPGRRNVVRLMNLHKAKGLEADVVILADAAHQFAFPITVRIVRGTNGAAPVGHLRIMRPSDQPWKSKPLAQAMDWDAHEQEERKYRDAERLRLLYVAGTRARDLLVLCRSSESGNNKAWDVFSGYFADAPELPVADETQAPSEADVSLASTEILAASLPGSAAARRDRHEVVGRPSWSVTAVTSDKSIVRKTRVAGEEALGADAAPQRADAGTAWGSLVHGLLEHAMRFPAATRPDLDRLARWLTEETRDLRPLIAEALDVVQAVSKLPLWQQARAGAEVHVEAPFAIRVDPPASTMNALPAPVPSVVRGVIDLVYRAGDGWHVVDYKTDVAADDAVLQERYSGQLGQYRAAWQRMTGSTAVSTRVVSARDKSRPA